MFGWGSVTGGSTAVPNELRTAEKDLVSMITCDARLRLINPEFSPPLQPTNICAARDHVSICNGDAGSPLVVGSPGNWVQVGVASWDSSCGTVFLAPSVYGRVSFYTPWIASQTGMPESDFTANF